MTALAGAPVAATRPTIADWRPRAAVPPGWYPRGAHRRPETEDQHDGDDEDRPRKEDQGIESRPGGRLCQPCLADGGERGQGEGDDDGAGGTGEADEEIAGCAECDQPTSRQAEGGQGGVHLALDGALAAERLTDHSEAGEPGQGGQHPPADGLGVNRRRHRSGAGVLVLREEKVPRVHLGGEPGKIGGAVAQSHKVLLAEGRPLTRRASECRCCVEVVGGGLTLGELIFGYLDPHHVEGNSRPRRVQVGPGDYCLLLGSARRTACGRRFRCVPRSPVRG